jgi:hypothetical protein
VPARTEPLSVWSLALGIASYVLAPVVAAVAAIITGRRAARAIRSSAGATGGAGMATAGQVLGWINIPLSILAAVLIAVGVSYFANHKQYTSLEPGDCFNHSSSGLTGLVATVSCNEPHQLETVGSFDYAGGGSWPGPAGFEIEALPECRGLARQYVARSTIGASLRVEWLYPGRAAWNGGTRTIVCALGNLDGSTRTGSVR